MAVMAREAWTDERLDDLGARMEKGFDEVKGEIRDLRTDMDTGIGELRNEMNSRFDSMEGRFDAIQGRFDSMQRTMIIGLVSIVASLIATQF